MGFGQLSKRNMQPSTSSLTRGRGFQIFRRTSNSPSGKIPSLQVRKAQLKESLLKYKDKKAEKKDMQKRNAAQALKFLRKLGRKLKNPLLKRRLPGLPPFGGRNADKVTQNRYFSNSNTSQGLNNSSNLPMASPAKSLAISESSYEKKISPRQSIY